MTAAMQSSPNFSSFSSALGGLFVDKKNSDGGSLAGFGGGYTSTTNVALGGAWHAQEAARQRSLELAAGAEVRAADAHATSTRLAMENDAMRQKVRVAMELLGEAREAEAEKDRAVVRARGAAAAAAAAGRAHVIARSAAERRATAAIQREVGGWAGGWVRSSKIGVGDALSVSAKSRVRYTPAPLIAPANANPNPN
jgi:hypothetical protein